jgi:predicted phosphohydrolase
VLIGGDLGEAFSWEDYLHQLDELLGLPIYFVLGNHDYYGGSLHEVRERAELITKTCQRLFWLPACGFVALDSRTALVGHGGWGDARAADFRQSRVLLNDYFLISELRAAAAIPEGVKTWWGEPSAILNAGLESQLNDLGTETARHFRETIPQALADHEHVIVLMHVPPFREACWYQGKVSDDNWAPHFCSIAAGEALVEVMQQHPQKRMAVLCGHTHGEGLAEILPNLQVRTGKAKYGQPEIQCIMDTDAND